MISISAVPDLRFAEETKAGALDDFGFTAEGIKAKEDGGSEDALEGGNQPAIFLATFVHTKRFQHLGHGVKSNRLALLPNRASPSDRDDPILPEWQPIVGMPYNLRNKTPFAALI